MKKYIFLILPCLFFLQSCGKWVSPSSRYTYNLDQVTHKNIPLSLEGYFIHKEDNLVCIIDTFNQRRMHRDNWSIIDNGTGMVTYYNESSSGWYNSKNINERVLACDLETDGFLFIEGVVDQILVIKSENGYGLINTEKRAYDNYAFTTRERIQQRGIILVEPVFNSYTVERRQVIFTGRNGKTDTETEKYRF